MNGLKAIYLHSDERTKFLGKVGGSLWYLVYFNYHIYNACSTLFFLHTVLVIFHFFSSSRSPEPTLTFIREMRCQYWLGDPFFEWMSNNHPGIFLPLPSPRPAYTDRHMLTTPLFPLFNWTRVLLGRNWSEIFLKQHNYLLKNIALIPCGLLLPYKKWN